LIVVLTLNPIADPGRRLTMYSAHTEKGALLSMVTSGVVVIIFSAAIGITGMYTYKTKDGKHGSIRKEEVVEILER
jgi:hypothetical protein